MNKIINGLINVRRMGAVGVGLGLLLSARALGASQPVAPRLRHQFTLSAWLAQTHCVSDKNKYL